MLRHDPDPVPTNAAEGFRRESYSNLGVYRRRFARIRLHTPPVADRIPQAKRRQKTLKTEGVRRLGRAERRLSLFNKRGWWRRWGRAGSFGFRRLGRRARGGTEPAETKGKYLGFCLGKT